MKKFMTAVAFALVLGLATQGVAQESSADGPTEVTYGGWAALGGAASFSLLTAAALGTIGVIYAPPVHLDCSVEPLPKGCRPNALEHTAAVLIGAAAIAGIYAGGWGSGKLVEKTSFDPVLGWSLAGGYLGVPTGVLLQNPIPRFKPEWLRQGVGVIAASGVAVGAAYAFGQFAVADGQAWPEFGIGAAGLATGLLIGTLVDEKGVWGPFLGGIGAVLGVGAAALAF